MKKPRWLRVLALFLGLSLIAAACGDDDDTADGDTTQTTEATGGDEGEATEGGTVVFAADQEPRGWNINTASSNLLALGMLTEVVFPSAHRATPEFDVVMDENLLESAEMTSEDPQVIEYVIHEDAVWSDGEPITADDFIFMWEMMKGEDSEIDVASTAGYDRVGSVEGSEDGKTVTVNFDEPFAEWQSMFSNMLPAHIIEELGDGDAVTGWNDGLSGENVPEFSGGPFMFEDYRPEQSVTLVPNPQWWGDAPHLDEIVIRFDVDDSGIPAALENEEIDMAYPQPQLDLVDQIEDLDGIDSEITMGLSFEHIDFNLQNSHLAKLEVRQAIALALDREDLVNRTVRQFSDEAQPLNNRIWMNNQEQYEDNAEGYTEQDIDGARDLLEGVGYDCSGEVCTHDEDGELTLRISTTGGNQLRENTQLVIQSQLTEAGIGITIDNAEGSAAFDKFFPESNLIEDQDYDIALFAWVATPFASANKALYSNPDPELVGSNNTGYQNPEVVDLFDQALSETDADVAADLYNEIDRLLWEDMPTTPLYQKPTYLPYRSSIEGVQDNASTAGPLWNAHEWRITS